MRWKTVAVNVYCRSRISWNRRHLQAECT